MSQKEYMQSVWRVIETRSYSELIRMLVETALWYEVHFSCLVPTNVKDTF
jgi:hypothetical protein